MKIIIKTVRVRGTAVLSAYEYHPPIKVKVISSDVNANVVSIVYHPDGTVNAVDQMNNEIYDGDKRSRAFAVAVVLALFRREFIEWVTSRKYHTPL